MSTPSPRHLLRQAIDAARQGDRPQARMFLAKVTEIAPEEPLAWLWRAGVAEEPEQALIWINRVLDLDPEQPNARRALAQVRLQAAIAVAAAGDFATARQLFAKAAEADPADILPWLHLADLARTHDEARRCLNEVLNRDPHHAGAQSCLRQIDEGQRKNTPSPRLSPDADTIGVSGGDRLIPIEFEPVADGPRQTPSSDAPRVMIVDDNPEVLEFVKRHLEMLGLYVIPAAGTDAAIDALCNYGVPDLFLIDSDMPRTDGFALGERLRQDESIARVPMVLLTLDDSSDTYFRAAASGFRETLCKPISPVSLRAAVSKYCRLQVRLETASWPELPEGILT